MLAGAEDYEGIAGVDDILGGGGGVEGALGGADGEDYGPQAPRDALVEVAHLFEADGPEVMMVM